MMVQHRSYVVFFQEKNSIVFKLIFFIWIKKVFK